MKDNKFDLLPEIIKHGHKFKDFWRYIPVEYFENNGFIKGSVIDHSTVKEGLLTDIIFLSKKEENLKSICIRFDISKVNDENYLYYRISYREDIEENYIIDEGVYRNITILFTIINKILNDE